MKFVPRLSRIFEELICFKVDIYFVVTILTQFVKEGICRHLHVYMNVTNAISISQKY